MSGRAYEWAAERTNERGEHTNERGERTNERQGVRMSGRACCLAH